MGFPLREVGREIPLVYEAQHKADWVSAPNSSTLTPAMRAMEEPANSLAVRSCSYCKLAAATWHRRFDLFTWDDGRRHQVSRTIAFFLHGPSSACFKWALQSPCASGGPP